jgi:hypothetical protein
MAGIGSLQSEINMLWLEKIGAGFMGCAYALLALAIISFTRAMSLLSFLLDKAAASFHTFENTNL